MGGGSPRFRRDMQATNVEAEGVLFVEVTDPKSGKSFRFYDFEHAVALALDGRPLDAVATDLRNNAQLELSPEQLAAFADQLEALGFLEGSESAEKIESPSTDAEGFFPPLTAEETGSFERPRILGEGGATAEILSQFTPEPEEVTPALATTPPPITAAPARPATTPPPAAAPTTPAPGAGTQPLWPPRAATTPAPATTPPPSPSPPARPAAPPASPPVASASPPTPAPRPLEPRTPEPDEIHPHQSTPELPALPGQPPMPALAMAPPLASPPLAPPPVAFRPSNGAHAAGDLEASLPADSPRSWRPLGDRQGLAAPAVDPPAPPPAPVPSQLSSQVTNQLPSNDSRRESLRLVPPPFPQETPPPLPGNPAQFDLPPLATAPTEPSPTAEPLFADAGPHDEADANGEAPEQPLVFNTGDPTFPPPLPEDPNAPVQRLELSMTRRFITPERAQPARSTRRIWLAYAGLGVAAALVVFMMVYRYFATVEPAPISVKVVVPSPTSVYRWWDASAAVQQTGGAPLTMPRDGKVAEVVPEGTRFVAGDVLVMLESAKPFRGAINHNKSRLAYYEQMRETMTQQDNRNRLKEAETKIAEKKRLITEAQEAFNNHALVASQPGEVAEALVTRGGAVKAGEPAVRLKSSGYRAVFELPRADADKARQLGFCRIEIEGKPLDCSLSAEGGDETHVAIELPNDPNLTGKTVRLARDRLDAVFSVPASALVRVGESDRLYVVAASGRAEMRVVAVADRGPGGATVTQGLDVGDRVIVDVPSGLKPEARVLISSTSAR